MNGDFPAGGAGYACPMCHMWVGLGVRHSCTGFAPQLPFYQATGWLCPKCQKAHAPWVQTCPEQQSVFVTGLSTTGGVGDDPSGGSVPQHNDE